MNEDLQVKRGDLCRLKMGGPIMTFEKVISPGKDVYCLCSWVKGDQIVCNCFYASQLTFLDNSEQIQTIDN